MEKSNRRYYSVEKTLHHSRPVDTDWWVVVIYLLFYGQSGFKGRSSVSIMFDFMLSVHYELTMQGRCQVYIEKDRHPMNVKFTFTLEFNGTLFSIQCSFQSTKNNIDGYIWYFIDNYYMWLVIRHESIINNNNVIHVNLSLVS